MSKSKSNPNPDPNPNPNLAAGEELGVIKEQAAGARPKANATSMVATRFHDDKSAYTGAHKLVRP